MHNTILFFRHFFELHAAWAYIVLFLGVIIEGEVVIISFGVMSHLGVFQAFPVLLVAFLGAMVKTMLGYYIGDLLGRKFPNSKFLIYLQKRIIFFFPRLVEKPFWSIFFSKFIVGINHVTLVFAGFSKINFKTYFKAELFSTIIWMSYIFGLGYFFSAVALSISKNVNKFLLIILLLIFAFMSFEKIATVFVEFFRGLKNGNGNGNGQKEIEK
ncbi:MAG: VTT domain-containing protein [Candidatus Paceibacterota bacterium]|jgi:membrane protein DedA with SNARE-associated domain